jgi:L-amino acid N-acyltransferase YncA
VIALHHSATRLATEADLPEILDIYNQSIPKRVATADLTPQTLEARIAWFRNRDLTTRPVIVHVDPASGVVAWGSFTNFKERAAYAPTAEISVYVADGWEGKGIGRAVVEDLLARAPSCGIDTVLAVTFVHNEPSLRLFKSKGFTQWGLIPDACIMDGVRRSVAILGLKI